MNTLLTITALLLLTACGPTGGTGGTGPQGVPGPTGPAGAAGTVISIVQLCPGFVAAYPSIFPEVAECINGELYGVYSANGGFLSALPSGTYYSNGIGASCNLVIDGCSVVQQ